MTAGGTLCGTCEEHVRNIYEDVVWGTHEILLKKFYVNTVHAGNVSECFCLNRGSKQGDPVSSLLFILCVEILSLKIGKKIKGLKIGNTFVKRTLYADDLTIMIEYDPDQLTYVVQLLKDFHSISGLKINASKTQCVMIGDVPRGNFKICEDLGSKSKDWTWD